MKYHRYIFERDLAWKILIDIRVARLPVDIIGICKMLGIKVLSYSEARQIRFGDGDLLSAVLPKGCGDGFCTRILEKPCIFYNDAAWRGRQRFTVAHELGHILSGISGSRDFATAR